jgi:hypothetical protein
MRLVILVVVAACGGAPPPREQLARHVTAPIDAMPVDSMPLDATPDAEALADDDPDGPAAAVVLPDPDDWYNQPPTLDEVDTTIAVTDLPNASATWPSRVRQKRGQRQLLALHVDQKQLWLAVVEDENGTQARYALGKTDVVIKNHTLDETTYSPRSRVADYTGPILFAIRIVPRGAKQPEQLVVYSDGAALLVAARPLGTKAWSRRLRADFEPGATFEAIGTTDPH